MTITPDTKSWTWVLERTCPECGFDTQAFPRADIARLTQANAEAWPVVLARPDAAQRLRPDEWSALEYACHVRDVYRLFAERVRMMLADDDPAYPNWDQDETAVAERYGEQDPQQVSAELVEAGASIARLFAEIPDDGWERTGRRSDGSRFTIESLGRYLLHDVEHHRHDVGEELRRLGLLPSTSRGLPLRPARAGLGTHRRSS